MADSLDDFFAKKDKSRKSKKKNITTEEMAKKLEESGKRSEKTRKAKDKSNVGTIITNMAEKEDEEWHDFEEEREKDYSGLKIQTLSIKDKEEELREQQQQEEEEKQKETAVGPWKLSPTDKSDNESDTDRASPVQVETETVTRQTAPQSGQGPNKYVPPHLRNQPTESSLNPVNPSSLRRSKGSAPKIADIVEFPTLGPNDSNDDNRGFQPVRHGIRESSPNRRAPNVSLDNKYGLLRNND